MSVVGLTSIGAGVALVWLMLSPDVASRLGTGLLAATMALMFLPAVAYAAWEWDRRWAASRN